MSNNPPPPYPPYQPFVPPSARPPSNSLESVSPQGTPTIASWSHPQYPDTPVTNSASGSNPTSSQRHRPPLYTLCDQSHVPSRGHSPTIFFPFCPITTARSSLPNWGFPYRQQVILHMPAHLAYTEMSILPYSLQNPIGFHNDNQTVVTLNNRAFTPPSYITSPLHYQQTLHAQNLTVANNAPQFPPRPQQNNKPSMNSQTQTTLVAQVHNSRAVNKLLQPFESLMKSNILLPLQNNNSQISENNHNSDPSQPSTSGTSGLFDGQSTFKKNTSQVLSQSTITDDAMEGEAFDLSDINVDIFTDLQQFVNQQSEDVTNSVSTQLPPYSEAFGSSSVKNLQQLRAASTNAQLFPEESISHQPNQLMTTNGDLPNSTLLTPSGSQESPNITYSVPTQLPTYTETSSSSSMGFSQQLEPSTSTQIHPEENISQQSAQSTLIAEATSTQNLNSDASEMPQGNSTMPPNGLRPLSETSRSPHLCYAYLPLRAFPSRENRIIRGVNRRRTFNGLHLSLFQHRDELFSRRTNRHRRQYSQIIGNRNWLYNMSIVRPRSVGVPERWRPSFYESSYSPISQPPRFIRRSDRRRNYRRSSKRPIDEDSDDSD